MDTSRVRTRGMRRVPRTAGAGPVPARSKGVLMDVGGVLVREYLPAAAAAWGARLGISARDFLAALYEGNDSGVLIGTVTEDAWWRTVGRRLGVGADVVAEVRRDLAARETWDEALVARLRGLRGGVHGGADGGGSGEGRVVTALVSNTWPDLRRRMTEGRLLDVADHLVLSCEVGCAKPDPRIYGIALRRTATEPGRTLFVDDVTENVEAARALGIAGHVHRETADTLGRIEAFLRGGAM
ncbi:HAD-IA family hydrolase [Streptomyces sp. NPDC052114]|uniref:HAD-IA family hydrolase n=1 Tax=unclassified Streptomyces TaxID=2593676 RepID=UPI0034297CDE